MEVDTKHSKPVISNHSFVNTRQEWFWMVFIFLLVVGLTVITWVLFNRHALN